MSVCFRGGDFEQVRYVMLFLTLSLIFCLKLFCASSVIPVIDEPCSPPNSLDPFERREILTKRSRVERCPLGAANLVHQALDSVRTWSFVSVYALSETPPNEENEMIFYNNFRPAEINERSRNIIKNRFEGVWRETQLPEVGYATVECVPRSWRACARNRNLAIDTHLNANRLYLVSCRCPICTCGLCMKIR